MLKQSTVVLLIRITVGSMLFFGFIFILTACGTPIEATPHIQTPTFTPTLTLSPNEITHPEIITLREACSPEPIVLPTLPAIIPGYTELDTTTSLHVTGTYHIIALEHYRLQVTGKIDTPLSLRFDDLRCLPKITDRPQLICVGYFVDVATWAGASLTHILELAGVREDATHIRLISQDGYTASVSLEEALSGNNFLAYEWEG